MTKPIGLYKKRDRHGRMVTHPITVSKGRLRKEPSMKIYKIPVRRRKIIAFDVDGTLKVGDPPGTISIAELKKLKQDGWVVGIISDAIKREKVEEAFGDEVDFLLSKTKTTSIITVGKGFATKVYVGDSFLDKEASKEAGWRFVKASEWRKRE